MLLNDARFIHPLVEHRRSTKLPRCPSPSTPHVRMCLCLTQLRTSNCHYVSHRQGLQEDMLLNDAKYIYPLVEHGWPAKLSRCPSSVVRRPMPLHTHIQLVPTIFRPDTAKWRKQGQGLRQHGTLQRSLSSMQTNAHKNVVLYTSTSSTQEGSWVSRCPYSMCSDSTQHRTSNGYYTPHCQRISIHQHYKYLATSGLMCDLGACLEDVLLNDARFIHPLA